MLCNKISKNPRKGFLQSLDWGMNKNKYEQFFELYITQAFFCPLSWNLIPPVPEIAVSMSQCPWW